MVLIGPHHPTLKQPPKDLPRQNLQPRRHHRARQAQHIEIDFLAVKGDEIVDGRRTHVRVRPGYQAALREVCFVIVVIIIMCGDVVVGVGIAVVYGGGGVVIGRALARDVPVWPGLLGHFGFGGRAGMRACLVYRVVCGLYWSTGMIGRMMW